MEDASNQAKPKRAIVVGASMVGLATARALSEHFEEVVLVEKDVLPGADIEHRRGVQQSWHIHNLTLRGQNELEELFPGYRAEAIRLGAVPIDHGSDVARCTDTGFCPLFETGFVAISATRALMETAERNLFRAQVSNVRMVEGVRTTGLITEGAGPSLRAVGVRTDSGVEPEIRGDFVVDCSGRAALWKGWFKELALPMPRETVVDSGCAYASRFYRPREKHKEVWKGMTIDPLFPQRPQWGVIVPLEDNKWVVTLGGFNGAFPPTDEAGFEAFSRNMQTPLFAKWLSEAEPLTPIRTFRKLEMRWNHFENFKQPVARFLAIGDSAWAYNPLYGQGMSIGVTCARILRDLLRERRDLDGIAKRYYPAAKKFAYAPWESTALLDFQWPKTEGKRPWYTMLVGKLGHLVIRAAQHEPRVFRELLQGIHLLKQSTEMVTPNLILGILSYLLRRSTASLPKADLTRIPIGTDG